MARLGAEVEDDGKAPVLGFGELVVERGRSRLGRVEEVGVTTAWDEGVRRKEDVSRGVAMVDMVGRGLGYTVLVGVYSDLAHATVS